MIRRKPSQLQTEVGFDRSTDIAMPAGVNAPAPIFILVIQDVTRRLIKTSLVPRAEQRVKKDVIRFECRVGFKFSAPVTILVLLREQIFARGIDRNRDPAPQIVDLAKPHLRRGAWAFSRIGSFFGTIFFVTFFANFFVTFFVTMRRRFIHRILQTMSPQLWPAPRQSLPQSPAAIRSAHSPA